VPEVLASFEALDPRTLAKLAAGAGARAGRVRRALLLAGRDRVSARRHEESWYGLAEGEREFARSAAEPG